MGNTSIFDTFIARVKWVLLCTLIFLAATGMLLSAPVSALDVGSGPANPEDGLFDGGLDLDELDLDLPPSDSTNVGGICIEALELEIFATDCSISQDIFISELLSAAPALNDIEEAAILDVMELHELPDTDRDKVIFFARNDVRAMIFTRLVSIAQKDTSARSADEQQVVDAYAEAIKDRRIVAAALARDEYDEWKADPCGYQPPVGSYFPDVCYSPTGLLFSTVPPPSSEEFTKYGVFGAYDFLSNPEKGLVVAAETATALAGKTAAIAAALASGGVLGIGVALAVVIAIYSSLKVIFPFSIGMGIGASGAAVSASSLLTIKVIALAGPAAVVFTAVMIAILQIINVATWEAIPGELDAAITEAHNPVDLTQIAQSENAAGLQEFYAAFIASTLPDEEPTGTFSNPVVDGSIPLESPIDDRFHVTWYSAIGTQELPDRRTIGVALWDRDDFDITWDVRLSGGWFVVNGAMPIENADGTAGLEEFETMSLKIPYVGWDGKNWTAWRIGRKSFVHKLEAGEAFDAENPEHNYISDEIRYMGETGPLSIMEATVITDETPPVITSIVDGTMGDNDWYVSDVSLSWDVFDLDSEVDTNSMTGCYDEVVNEDISDYMRSCTAASSGGEATESVTIKRDATPPIIATELSSLPNEQGWHNTSPVSVLADCQDETSGIASCESKSVDGEGSREAYPTATDNAGNQSSTQVVVLIDTLVPTISGAASPPANAAGWNNTDVTVTFTCADSVIPGLPRHASGIASCTSPQLLTSEGIGQEVEGTASDRADNMATTTVGGIKIDKTPPTVILTTPPGGMVYVQNEIVLAEWNASDGLSGIDSANGNVASGQPIDTAGAGGHSFEVVATDIAGNTSEVSHNYTVFSAAQASESLMTQVDAVVSHDGIRNSLRSKLDAVLQSLAEGNRSAARGQLGAFINEVEDLRGEEISVADADSLIAYAQLILGAF